MKDDGADVPTTTTTKLYEMSICNNRKIEDRRTCIDRMAFGQLERPRLNIQNIPRL